MILGMQGVAAVVMTNLLPDSIAGSSERWRPATECAQSNTIRLRTNDSGISAPTEPVSDPAPSNNSRKAKNLTWFDLVGIAQDILIDLEDLHVRPGAAELVFGDLTQRVARLHRVCSA